jgi:hypothetical protein
MKPNVVDFPKAQSVRTPEPQEGSTTHVFGPKFVDTVIHALSELDAEHLAALAQAAERFINDALPGLTPEEAVEMKNKMDVFAALLADTRRNLRIFALASGKPSDWGYTPGSRQWVD